MTTVKYAVSAYTADGTTTDYLITWDYLDEDHIAVYVDGTSNADPTANHTFTKLNNTTLRITDGIGGAVVSGADIEIRRETPLLTRAITFADGSALLAEDLNKNSDYLLYSMQEVLDTVDAAAQDGALAAEVATQALRDEAEDLRDDTVAARNTTQTYLATVQSDATDADNHRIAAGASETAAAASEAASAASEAASAASEVAAAASETAAATSETNAAASEAASAASEAAAAASETAAAASEVAAASSETNAEAAWDSLDDRYLGAKATAPTLDNDGDALQTGALYWNSTSDGMYVWNGSSWDTFNSTTGIADSAASTAVTIDPSGNVGIGTSSPTNFTNGTVVEAAGGTNTGAFLASSNNGTVVAEVQGNNADGLTYFGSRTNHPVVFRQNGSERMRIDSSGNVGVGTSSPVAHSNRTTLGLNGAWGGQLDIMVGSTVHAQFGTDNFSSGQSARIQSQDGIVFKTSGDNERMRIDASGRVTMPYQPVISGQIGTALINPSSPQKLAFNEFWTSVGITYNSSTRRFTVPSAGKYSISINPFFNAGTANGRVLVGVNNDAPNQTTHYGHCYRGSADYETGCINSIVYLSANDYIVFYLMQGMLYSQSSDRFNQFTIHKIA